MEYAAFGSCAMSLFRIQALDLFRRMSESIANGEKAFPGGDAPKGDGASSSRSEKVRPLDAGCSLLLARCGITRWVLIVTFAPMQLGPAAEKEFAAYIEANVRPALRKALVNVAKSRPSDPLTFLSSVLRDVVAPRRCAASNAVITLLWTLVDSVCA